MFKPIMEALELNITEYQRRNCKQQPILFVLVLRIRSEDEISLAINCSCRAELLKKLCESIIEIIHGKLTSFELFKCSFGNRDS